MSRNSSPSRCNYRQPTVEDDDDGGNVVDQTGGEPNPSVVGADLTKHINPINVAPESRQVRGVRGEKRRDTTLQSSDRPSKRPRYDPEASNRPAPALPATENLPRPVPVSLFAAMKKNWNPLMEKGDVLLQPVRYSLPRSTLRVKVSDAKPPADPANFTRITGDRKISASSSVAPLGRKGSTAFTATSPIETAAEPPRRSKPHPAAGTTTQEIARKLRPIPDFVELMRQIAPAIGDPGTGPCTFGATPSKNIFLDPEHESLKRELNENDPKRFVNEKEVVFETAQKQRWAKKFLCQKSSETPEKRNASEDKQGWKGRRWSVDPNTKTRNLYFEVLEERISHQKLLSLDLSVDARHDAMLIGGKADDFGYTPEKELNRTENDKKAKDRKKVFVKELPSSSIDFPAKRPEMINPPLPESDLKWYFTETNRKNSAVRKSSMSLPTLAASSSTSKMSKVARNGRGKVEKDEGGYDFKSRRYISQGVDRTFQVGRYGFNGLMNWRLVKVTAKVDIIDTNGKMKTEDASAWYCIPDKAMGGWF